MPIERVIFWEPTVSPHKFPFFEAIAESRRFSEVVCVAQSEISPERVKLGWTVAEPQKFRLLVNPSQILINEIMQSKIEETLHVFSGMRHVPCIVSALYYAVKYSCKFSLMSEPRNSDGFLGRIRYLHSWISERRLRRYASFVLAIGRNGPPWFRSVGYQAEKVYPFAYFVNSPVLSGRAVIEVSASCKKIIYVGRLVKEKGVFDLLKSFAKLDQKNNQLLVIGDGVDREELMALAMRLSLNCIFFGAVPITEVPDLINVADLLVLPSRTTDDGWGVVVSEALLLGVPVVASNMAGASILLENRRLGCVFQAGDINGLTEAITAVLINANGVLGGSDFRAKWAHLTISAQAGSDYFVSIVDHVFDNGAYPVDFYLKNVNL